MHQSIAGFSSGPSNFDSVRKRPSWVMAVHPRHSLHNVNGFETRRKTKSRDKLITKRQMQHAQHTWACRMPLGNHICWEVLKEGRTEPGFHCQGNTP